MILELLDDSSGAAGAGTGADGVAAAGTGVIGAAATAMGTGVAGVAAATSGANIDKPTTDALAFTGPQFRRNWRLF